MSKPSKPRNAFYAQSGGVTAVINASAAGVIDAARRHRRHIGKVLAGRDGIVGGLTEDLIDVGAETPATLQALRYTPAGAFGSARFKLKGLDQNRAEYERLIEVFRAHDIGYFFYNGGNDSMDTALKVSQIGATLGYPIVCIGVPKTVDNDLPITDCCPGFGSVAKYVAVSTREAALDVASMARTSTKVFVLEVMGRHAGWIAAAGGLAGNRPDDPPQLILFPEITFNRRCLSGQGETQRGEERLLRGRGIRGRKTPRRQVPGRSRHHGRLRARATGRRGPGDRTAGQGPAGLQVPLGHGRLPAAGGAAHRLEDRRGAGLCGGQGRGGVRCQGHERGDAGHHPHLGQALPVEDRAGAAGGCGQCGEEGAAQVHHRGRLRHHRGLPALPARR